MKLIIFEDTILNEYKILTSKGEIVGSITHNPTSRMYRLKVGFREEFYVNSEDAIKQASGFLAKISVLRWRYPEIYGFLFGIFVVSVVFVFRYMMRLTAFN